jgi:deazaflavin-dependent oxidoreductase (nitroreductase family)
MHVEELAKQSFCYLTTIGRRSGRPHTVEIWFGLRNATLYMLSGSRARSDWVRNLQARPDVQVRIRDSSFPGRARVVEDPDEESNARRLLAAKYQGWREGAPLSSWARTALPVAVDLSLAE